MSTRPLRVLLAGAGRDSRGFLVSALSDLGCRVESADSADSALARVRAGGLDLVLADERMGAEAVLGLMAEGAPGRQPLLVLMTAYPAGPRILEAFRAGAFGFFVKPVRHGSLEHLFGSVRRALRPRRWWQGPARESPHTVPLRF